MVQFVEIMQVKQFILLNLILVKLGTERGGRSFAFVTVLEGPKRKRYKFLSFYNMK